MPVSRVNQHKPVVPDDVLIPLIRKYNDMGVKAPEMVKYIRQEVGPEYGISVSTVKKRIATHNIPTVRRQQHTPETIMDEVREIKKLKPDVGSRTLVSLLRQQCNIFVTEKVVARLLKTIEPEAVEKRKKGKYRRRQYLAAGVNENWTMDQHNKARKFGIALHVCVEPFSGYVIWAKAWHTNRNPRVVAGWYLEAVRKLEAIPMFTQSDPGTENFGVANIHTMIRQSLDAALANFIQHRWMRKHQNIKPEIFWSGFRRNFIPGFENLFMQGGPNGEGWYNDRDDLQTLVYRWIVIPWFQDHLDSYIYLFNHTKRRASKNKILPQGKAPVLIFQYPQLSDGLDFKLPIKPDSPILKRVEDEFAPPDDPVFQLVPPGFDAHAKEVYNRIGAPDQISVDNLWDVFRAMSDVFKEASETLPRYVPYTYEEPPQGTIQLLEGYQELVAPRALRLPEGVSEQSGSFSSTVSRAMVEASASWWRIDAEEHDSGKDMEAGDMADMLSWSNEDLARKELFAHFVDITDSEDEDEDEDEE